MNGKEKQNVSWEEARVNRSLSQGKDLEWMIHVATWPSTTSALLETFNPSGSSTKMSLACCHLEEGQISLPSSAKWQNSGSKQSGSKGQKNTLFAKDSPGDKSEDPSSDTGRGIDSNPLKPAGSLTAGMYHHGSINNQCLGTNGHLIMEERKLVHCAEVAPTLTSSGPPYSRTGNSRVESDALAVMDGRGVDIWNNKLTGHVASTMGTNTGIAIDNGPMVFDDYESQLLVRRLMPVECCKASQRDILRFHGKEKKQAGVHQLIDTRH